MAKVAAKNSSQPKKTASKAKASSPAIDQVCENILTKLRELNIDQQLQNDIEWCLGSYRSDNNPVGLYAMVEKAIAVFKDEKDKKTKGVTAKLITDLEKAIQKREG